jgi:uncharacterized membrane protein
METPPTLNLDVARIPATGPDEDVRRLAALSDGVIAIAMTLLVLDLAKPDPASIHSTAELHHLLAQWNAYASFALSFVVIAIYWTSHFRTFRRLTREDGPVLVLNLAYLLGITFIPFPTAMLQRFSDDRVVVMLYAGTIGIVGFIWAALWNHAAKNDMIAGDVNRRKVLLDILEAPGVFLLSMVIAWFSPSWAQRSWLLIIVVGRGRAFLDRRR